MTQRFPAFYSFGSSDNSDDRILTHFPAGDLSPSKPKRQMSSSRLGDLQTQALKENLSLYAMPGSYLESSLRSPRRSSEMAPRTPVRTQSKRSLHHVASSPNMCRFSMLVSPTDMVNASPPRRPSKALCRPALRDTCVDLAPELDIDRTTQHDARDYDDDAYSELTDSDSECESDLADDEISAGITEATWLCHTILASNHSKSTSASSSSAASSMLSFKIPLKQPTLRDVSRNQSAACRL